MDAEVVAVAKKERVLVDQSAKFVPTGELMGISEDDMGRRLANSLMELIEEGILQIVITISGWVAVLVLLCWWRGWADNSHLEVPRWWETSKCLVVASKTPLAVSFSVVHSRCNNGCLLFHNSLTIKLLQQQSSQHSATSEVKECRDFALGDSGATMKGGCGSLSLSHSLSWDYIVNSKPQLHICVWNQHVFFFVMIEYHHYTSFNKTENEQFKQTKQRKNSINRCLNVSFRLNYLRVQIKHAKANSFWITVYAADYISIIGLHYFSR